VTATRDTPDALPVPAALAGERVDRAVALLTGWSRAEAQALLAAGTVLVDGRPAIKSLRLRTGAVIELLAEPEPDELPGPEPVPLDVRWADADVIVVHKPAGLVVHPGAGHEHGTLVHGLLDAFPELVDVGDPRRPGIVHRLDRDTSGLLLVARSERAYPALVEALADRTIERRYLALVRGTPEASRAVVDAPIGRSTRRRTRMAVRAEGRPAQTEYEVLATGAEGRVALLECRLETGRTHQIRVHLAAIGHPVLGDVAYGPAGSPSTVASTRPFLHAHQLAFTHPVSGEPHQLQAALPDDLVGVLADLEVEAPEVEDRPARADDVEGAG
jgi:23S rRNA pseudouridine1911/1915/1917 synthase